MKPRAFAREGDEPLVLILTYAVDLHFLEQVVLQDLGVANAQTVLVVADRFQMERTLTRAPGPYAHLGRRYALATPFLGTGSFHPKIILKLGVNGGRVWIGSGNLTMGGWGLNQELAVSWRLGRDGDEPGAWVRMLIDDARGWVVGEAEQDMLARMGDLTWVRDAVNADPSPIISSTRATLGSQLASRWQGRRFTSLKVLTGSTDHRGGMVSWAHQQFGVENAHIALTPTTCSFDPDALEQLPFDVRIQACEGPRPLHAKFYWFDGPEGPACVMGSANCSAAAWLVPKPRGNDELVVVWDQAEPSAFADILRTFESGGERPSATLRPPTDPEEDAESSPSHWISDLLFDPDGTELRLRIVPDPGEGGKVDLILGTMSLAAARKGDSWVIGLEVPPPRGVLATALIRAGGETLMTSPRWITHLGELRETTLSRKAADTFARLVRGDRSSGMLEMLIQVGAELIADHETFKDPLAQKAVESKEPPEVGAQAIVPERLLAALRDTSLPVTQLMSGSTALSLVGLFRALFGEESTEVPEAVLDEDPPDPNQPSKPRPKRRSGDGEEGTVSDKEGKKLERSLHRFLTEVESPDYAGRCTVSQLTQALAFPLVVARAASDRAWVDLSVAVTWSERALRAALAPDGRGVRKAGLLDLVRSRYRESGQSERFDAVIGDGLLWVVMAAVASSFPCSDDRSAFVKAGLLRLLFTRPELTSHASEERLAALLTRYKMPGGRESVHAAAAPINALMEAIERAIRPRLVDLLGAQEGAEVRAGDLFWSPGRGWAIAIARGTTKKVEAYHVEAYRTMRLCLDADAGEYAILRLAAEFDPHLRELEAEFSQALARLCTGLEP